MVSTIRRRHIADRFEQASMIEPVDPLEWRELDDLDVPPRAALPNDLGPVESDDRLGECVVVRVTDAADRRLDAGFSEPLRVAEKAGRFRRRRLVPTKPPIWPCGHT